MRRSTLPAIAVPLSIAALLVAPLAAGAQTNGMSANGMPPLTAGDTQFIQHASQTNEAEIASGRLAERRGDSTTVRMLGKRYVDNHRTNEATLEALAQQYGVTLNMQPPAHAVMEMQRLEALHGPAFDRAFLADEQKDHEKAIRSFKDEVRDGSAPAIVAYAKHTLPVLDEHLLLATEDADRLQMSDTGMRGDTSGAGMSGNGMTGSAGVNRGTLGH